MNTLQYFIRGGVRALYAMFAAGGGAIRRRAVFHARRGA
jgi:hypothetical protein